MYGVGKASVYVRYHDGSVDDLAGEGAVIGGHYGRGGADIELNDKNHVSGANVHLGVGYSLRGGADL